MANQPGAYVRIQREHLRWRIAMVKDVSEMVRDGSIGAIQMLLNTFFLEI